MSNNSNDKTRMPTILDVIEHYVYDSQNDDDRKNEEQRVKEEATLAGVTMQQRIQQLYSSYQMEEKEIRPCVDKLLAEVSIPDHFPLARKSVAFTLSCVPRTKAFQTLLSKISRFGESAMYIATEITLMTGENSDDVTKLLALHLLNNFCLRLKYKEAKSKAKKAQS